MVQKIEATDVTDEEALNAAFFERADEFIKQANDFCRIEKGSSVKPTEMRDAKDQVMSYVMQQFQMMLEDNYDEYCEQFENYLRFRHNEEFHANKHDASHKH